ERRLYEIAMRTVPERDALGLLRPAAWKVVPTGTTLLTQGRSPESLMLISEGAVNVEMDGKLVDTLGQGRFLAATAFLTRKAGYQTRVTVTATEQTRIVTWSMDELEAQLDDDLDLKVAMEASLGLELSRLLQTSRAQLIHLQSV
ncbi:MAG: cyclic nucleotide-binding domain-containing protein, partial [Chloroflexota bacterium]